MEVAEGIYLEIFKFFYLQLLFESSFNHLTLFLVLDRDSINADKSEVRGMRRIKENRFHTQEIEA